MSHTRHEGNDCVVDTKLKSRRRVNDVPVATTTASGDSSLAARELSFLVRLAQAAAATPRPDGPLRLIIREARRAGKVVRPVGDGITVWVAESRRPAVVPDVSKEPHWKWVPGLDEDRFHSMLSVPVESGPRLVGVINVQSTERREFNSADIDFLRAIAGQVAGILERSELQRRTEIQLAEIQLSHDIHERFNKLSLEGAGVH